MSKLGCKIRRFSVVLFSQCSVYCTVNSKVSHVTAVTHHH